MRILVVVRQVPDSRASLSVLPDGSGLDLSGVKLVCDPFDEFGVEQAVQLRKQRSDVQEIVAITAGPLSAVQALRSAIAMGADRGIHIALDESAMHDELYIARALAGAISRDEQGFDLSLCGKQGINNDAGELGPALAEMLGLPHIGAVVDLKISESGDCLDAKRQIEGGVEVVETSLPALITCERGLVNPRFPTLPNIVKARKKPVETVDVNTLPGMADAVPATSLIALALPPEREVCKIIEGKPAEMAKELVRVLREEARVI